ncbi:MAG TPA: cytochrome c oxidase assembly protein, partial [Acidimicrobiia bacterium]|nr:cytochrome c oxidase assembly protein [Acidimicrobiia bacterium]
MIPPFHPHYDVWALAFALAFGYWYADRRLRPVLAPDAPPATTGQKWQWYGAVVALWLVSGWPIHDIGETSLFTVHMVEHMVIALVIPPLMLRG